MIFVSVLKIVFMFDLHNKFEIIFQISSKSGSSRISVSTELDMQYYESSSSGEIWRVIDEKYLWTIIWKIRNSCISFNL